MIQCITCNILKRMFLGFQAHANQPLKRSATEKTQEKSAGGKPSRASHIKHPFVMAI
jgi:hypothetical protein